MKVLLIGEHYSDNLGDDAISFCMQRILKKYETEYDLFELSGREGIPTRNINSQKKRFCLPIKMDYLRMLKNIYSSRKVINNFIDRFENDYDMALYDGGSVFMDYFAPRMFFLNSHLKKNNIPIFYYGCGMSTLSWFFNKILLSLSLRHNNIIKIYMRDSIDMFNELYCKNAVFSPDSALTISDFIVVRSSEKKKIGVGYIYLNDLFNEVYDKSLARFLCILEEKEIEWELFTNGSISDYNRMEEFYKSLGNISFGTIGRRATSVVELVTQINSYEKILCARLHCSIIAFSYLIPTVSVVWNSKVKDFYRTFGRDEYLVSYDFDAQSTFEKLVSCAADSEMACKIEEYKRSVYKTVREILNR